MIVLVRYLTQVFDPLQVAFFRSFFGLVAMLPWLLGKGLVVLHTQRIWLHVLRAVVAIIAMTMWFTTLALLPLAEATALSFVAPVFTSVLAVVFLGEIMRVRRWTATALSFAGALLIVRPGFESVEPAALLALATALVWGSGSVIVKLLARTESSATVVTWFGLFVTPLALVPALFVWQTPTLEQLGWLALLGFSGSAGHVCVARALAVADASLIAPFDYLRLPVVALIAYLAFDEVPDVWVWLGGGVIAGSSLYIAHRESRAKPTGATVPTTPAPGS
jgi:drug/metabolite transporter (DMT)-like permease